MRALFLTAELGGNVPPTLAVADELARRGVDVEVAGLAAGRSSLPQPDFEPALAAAPGRASSGPAKAGRMLRLMAGRRTRAAAERVVLDRRADAVVVDCMLPAVLAGALRTGVPVAVLFHTVGAYWLRTFDGGPGRLVFGALGLRPRRLWERASARLILTDRALDSGRDLAALRTYSWTGTTETGTAPNPRDVGARPRVLVALSSTDWPGMLPVYRRIVSALARLPVDAVVTTGGVDLGGELERTSNVEVRGWADHAALLPGVDLMISHGGHSSTMKTLAHGVPLLVLPINPTSDQRLIGQTVQRERLGAWLPKRAHVERITATVQRLLDDADLRTTAARNGERMRKLRPGAEVAADRIIHLMEGSLAGSAATARELQHDRRVLEPVGRARSVTVPTPCSVSHPSGRTLAGLIHGPESGTPVLFIAGAGTGKSMVFGEDLLHIRGIQLITMDRPGMGGSDPDPARTASSTAEDYRTFVAAALGKTDPVVPIVAHSQGALFGLAAAAQGWAKPLVLASPADEVADPSVRELLPDAARALPDLAQDVPEAARELLASLTPEAMRTMVIDGSDAQDRSVYTATAFDALYRTALAEGFAGDGRSYVADTMMATTRWPVDLATIGTPVTVLFGARDRVHSPDHGAHLTTRIPHARRTVISEAGGALLWTHSGLVFDAALQRPGSPSEGP